jgi:GNAT superfamily N-acetyltransferase
MITLITPAHDRVAALRAQISQQSPLTLAILFGGDRWQSVEVCGVATQDGRDVGLASLAPCDECGQPGPHIIGVWIAPESRRGGLGAALLVALAAESQRRYGAVAAADAVSAPGWQCVQAAQRAGAALVGRDLSGGVLEMLPW